MVPKHFLLLLLPCFITVCSAMTTVTNITTDRLALLALKDSITDLPSRQILDKNWTVGSSVCDWIGVTCGSRHLRVIGLDLSNMGLVGTLPPQLGNLSFLLSLDVSGNNFHGELPDEFSGLRRLQMLRLTNNQITGQFPLWIASLQELEYLYIWNNSLSGVIPPSISNLTRLAVLSASYNNLQGKLPAEIFNISSLTSISLGFNSFSAGSSLPDDTCEHLPMLNRLDVAKSGLSGQIPSSINQCSQLQQIFLFSNSLTGEIPIQIGELKELQALALWDNRLEGTIPKEIGNLSMLQMVGFDENNLTGVIPEEVGKLSKIQIFQLSFNKLVGSIPDSIFNISTLIFLDFEGNYLSGYLPSEMCYTLPNLQDFYLAENSISGTIPQSISNCTNLQTLEFGNNNFTGYIPNSLENLSLLNLLALHNNHLICDPSFPTLNLITSLSNSRNLTILSIMNNPLGCILPDSIGNLSSTLEYIYADNCEIKGIIPSGIGNLSSLNTLSLANNQLSGSLPDSIKKLQNLQRMILSRNKMNISLQIFCACQNLGALYLEGNPIIGTIPDCFGNITSMRSLFLSSTGLNSSLSMSFWNLTNLLELNVSSNSLTGSLPLEINNLKAATMMDFSSNHISGEIPSTIGDLGNLQNLSLAHNQLKGYIPEAIGNMLSLEQLDLSYNFLSGSLPMSLQKLQGLIIFNVSFNNLSGEIPSQGPFINMTAESFISNQALCGAPKFHVLPCTYPSHQHKKISINVHKVVIILIMMISITVGITCLGFIYQKLKKKGKRTIDDHEGFSMITNKRISYYELLRATDKYNPSNLLGTGSFGSVYKGTLEDGEIVAIKVFNLQLEGSFKSFDTECEALQNLRHRNITKVISSCSNPDFKGLVLEYMPNGSLDSWLHSNKIILNVMQRLNILIDVAFAIQYLHCGNLTPVVHCDLKPSNVLLDQELVAHVSDFGIAKLLGQNDVTYTKTLATLCYIAPEYASEGLISTRCDIYSFGIMIMEVFTGKNPNDEMFGEKLSLKSWVQESIPDKLVNVIDVDLLSTFNQHLPQILANILSIMDVAMACTSVSPKERSNIEEVLASLNKIKLQLQPYANGIGGECSQNQMQMA